MEFGFAGIMLAVIVWWLLVRRLRNKPWLEQGVLPASQDSLTSNPAKVGLLLFLGVVASLFLILNSAYLLRMELASGFAPWVPVDEPGVLWVTTLVLALASVAMQLATGAAARDDVQLTRTYYIAAGVLTLVFLGGQLLAWRQLAAAGDYGAGTPAFAFFILITAIHGLHLLGGLVVLARTSARLWTSVENMTQASLAAARQSVQLTAIYWHFLLIVWIGIFALLSTT